MSQPNISRVIVDQKEDWDRVRGNADATLTACVEARLATLPGGATGEVARRVRPLLEKRVEAVRAQMWEIIKPNLSVNGMDYEVFAEGTSNLPRVPTDYPGLAVSQTRGFAGRKQRFSLLLNMHIILTASH
jgi:hypothetical protein